MSKFVRNGIPWKKWPVCSFPSIESPVCLWDPTSPPSQPSARAVTEYRWRDEPRNAARFYCTCHTELHTFFCFDFAIISSITSARDLALEPPSSSASLLFFVKNPPKWASSTKSAEKKRISIEVYDACVWNGAFTYRRACPRLRCHSLDHRTFQFRTATGRDESVLRPRSGWKCRSYVVSTDTRRLSHNSYFIIHKFSSDKTDIPHKANKHMQCRLECNHAE